MAASRGAFALLCYCAISLYFIAISLRVASGKTTCALRAIATGSLLAQIYFHVLGIVDSNFFDREVKNMLTFLWAITLAAAARLDKIKTKVRAAADGPSRLGIVRLRLNLSMSDEVALSMYEGAL